jgi:hypothetical protein
VEVVFVQLLTRAGNREGNRIIAFGEPVSCDIGNRGFLSQNARWTGHPHKDDLRHTAKGKTKVPLTGSEDSQEAPSVRVE